MELELVYRCIIKKHTLKLLISFSKLKRELVKQPWDMPTLQHSKWRKPDQSGFMKFHLPLSGGHILTILNKVQGCQYPIYESTSCPARGKYGIWLPIIFLFTCHNSLDTCKAFLAYVFITLTSHKWNMWNEKNTVPLIKRTLCLITNHTWQLKNYSIILTYRVRSLHMSL